VTLNVLDLASDGDSERILAVDEAIRRLEAEDARLGQVVRLRFFSGLSVDETAKSLGSSPRTVARDWTFARAWLYDVLREFDVRHEGDQDQGRLSDGDRQTE
jgi:DNA-directed RNA polymerase specialized sigma24 family protein